MSDTRKEKRRYERHDYPLQIEYVLDQKKNGETVHRGVTVNISAAGLGAYVLDPLSVGQRVIIRTGLPFDRKLAIICWITEKSASFYSAGMKFI
jgi:c-di-GMP-binding flagellar brake protein YcgR